MAVAIDDLKTFATNADTSKTKWRDLGKEVQTGIIANLAGITLTIQGMEITGEDTSKIKAQYQALLDDLGKMGFPQEEIDKFKKQLESIGGPAVADNIIDGQKYLGKCMISLWILTCH